jgi:hypothetical protein
MKYLAPFLFSAGLTLAQTAGVASNWDVSQSVSLLRVQAQRLQPILDQLTPSEWVTKGAPQTYVSQWQSARQDLGYLNDAARALERQPEKLSVALDTYFRLQTLEARLASLTDGVRRYQNPAVGDLLVGVMGENSANRDGLRQYISDLAVQKEQELAVIDKEAQRCRTIINRQPAPAPAKRTGKQ